MKAKSLPTQIKNETLKINCHYHQDELLRFFCKKEECLQPLCKVCLNIHLEEHKVSGDIQDVIYFEKCIAEVQKKMTQELQHLSSRIEEFDNQITRFINFKCEQNWFSLIQQAESQALEIVQSYFRNVKSFLISEYPSIQKLEIAKDSVENFKVRQEQLRAEIQNLSNQNAVSQLILYYQGDVQKLNKKYLDQLEQMIVDFNEIDFSQIQVPLFKIKNEMTTKLYDLLGQYAYFEQLEMEEEYESQKEQANNSNEQSENKFENEEMEYY